MDKIVMSYQPDILVIDKQRKTAVVTNVAISNDSNNRKKEHHQEDLEDEGNSGPSDNHNTWCSDLQVRCSDHESVVPAEPRYNIRDLCLEEHSPGNS